MLFIAALVVTLIALCLSAAGCASGRGVNGETVVGFPVGSAAPDGLGDALTTAGEVLGGLFGGPAGAAIGGSVATALAGLLVLKKHGEAKAATAQRDGERAGWDERDQHQASIDRAYDDGARDAISAPTNSGGERAG